MESILEIFCITRKWKCFEYGHFWFHFYREILANPLIIYSNKNIMRNIEVLSLRSYPSSNFVHSRNKFIAVLSRGYQIILAHRSLENLAGGIHYSPKTRGSENVTRIPESNLSLPLHSPNVSFSLHIASRNRKVSITMCADRNYSFETRSQRSNTWRFSIVFSERWSTNHRSITVTEQRTDRRAWILLSRYSYTHNYTIYRL